ncbi:unnamed protein product [Darwinula stevensoni]|uniref:Peptidase M13 N-terminal domain-containing protein n=1 Tax=Darwinula stevensoni TaxID=69355 RepID=A0A7R9AGT7_9CRUS|nr:unnamed protein product [Darwinula stevensoni]CAG0904821.1 unnamed protein product [Darwinula stevensoni]
MFVDTLTGEPQENPFVPASFDDYDPESLGPEPERADPRPGNRTLSSNTSMDLLPPDLLPLASEVTFDLMRNVSGPEALVFWSLEMQKYMNTSADPCADFHEFACGSWGLHHHLSEDKAVMDTFEILREKVDHALRDILEQPEEVEAYMRANVEAKRFYRSCMDTDRIEQLGASPLQSLMRELGGWPAASGAWDEEGFDWLQLLIRLRGLNNMVLIRSYLGIDPGNHSDYTFFVDEPTLVMPTRDYYLEKEFAHVRDAYLEMAVNLTVLVGGSMERASVHAREMLRFETRLAELLTPAEEKRDYRELYAKMTTAELRENVTSEIDWLRYFREISDGRFNESDSIVIYSPAYFQRLVHLLRETPSWFVASRCCLLYEVDGRDRLTLILTMF